MTSFGRTMARLALLPYASCALASTSPACHVPAALLHDPCVRSVTVRVLRNACAVTAVTACSTFGVATRSRHVDASPCFAFNGGRVCD